MIEGDQTETDVSCFMTDDSNPSEKCEDQKCNDKFERYLTK